MGNPTAGQKGYTPLSSKGKPVTPEPCHLIHVFLPETATNESNMVSAVSPTMAPTPGMTCLMTSDTVTLSLLLKTD